MKGQTSKKRTIRKDIQITSIPVCTNCSIVPSKTKVLGKPLSTKIDDIVPHLADPPFEYSTPAMSDLPKKSLSENTAEIKKGLLSSILEKVKSKEEAESQISRNNKRLLTAPLASSESLSVSDTSTKRMSATSSNLESTTSSMPNPTVVLKFRNVCALFGKIWHFLRFRIQKPFLKYSVK